MYEEAEPVRTPQAGSDRKQPSHDPPGRQGNTNGHVHRGKQAGLGNKGGQGTSSNVYEEAEVVKLKNISGDVPYGTDTSTDTDTTQHVGARVYCMVAALAVVVALAITGPIVLMFINGGYNHEEGRLKNISQIPTTVGAFNLEHKQNQTAAMEQRLIEKTAVQCPLLSPLLHGSVSGSNSYGDVVHFTCEQGYRLVGKSSLTCLSDGTWNGNSPTCTAAQCALLSPPLHGSVSGSNSYGDVVHFTCDQGHRLVGKSSLTCLSDGTWNGNSPTCTAVQCPSLSPPLHGSVSGSNSYDDVVHFTCDQGYRLVGKSSLTCLSDGTWSGRSATCADMPRYLGCYKDSFFGRRFPSDRLVSDEMTTDTCIKHCQGHGHGYAATQYSHECFCGSRDNFFKLGKRRPDSECDNPCSGRSTSDEFCGGWWRMSVYMTERAEAMTPLRQILTAGIQLQRLGCWGDTADRAVPTLEGTDPVLDGPYPSRTDALRKCQDAAAKRGFTVFAVQNGGQCAASADALQTYVKYGPSDACRPDGEGGPWANEVYRIVSPTETGVTRARDPGNKKPIPAWKNPSAYVVDSPPLDSFRSRLYLVCSPPAASPLACVMSRQEYRQRRRGRTLEAVEAIPDRKWSSIDEFHQTIRLPASQFIYVISVKFERVLNVISIGVKEAVYIRTNCPTLNRDGGRHRLSDTSGPLLQSRVSDVTSRKLQ
ncbi:hypothetical protein Bbelb_387810 [Branchiostoma belcheri]|nr:hypothetical protein Bbelb_387810 [Branchiostoma belcheri]